jgi:hypothetical protein
MKQIVKKFNNLVKKTIFKVQNKTNNNFNISNFNKYFITLIALLFIYLFYLLIPILYSKTWVQTSIESKLLNEFKINLSTSADISYRILPAPHFLIKDSKILTTKSEKKTIAAVKECQIFLSQKNFFDKEKMNIKEIVINGANFTLLRSDLKLLNELKNKKFSNKKIKINNSNIFLKDNSGEIISIIKVDKTVLFFNDKKLFNFLNLKGKIFNVPFTLDLNNHNNSIKYEKINFNSKLLKLNISNESTTNKKLTSGENNISFLKSTISTKYDIKEKLITFKSGNSILNNTQISYDGELSINPFDLNLNIDLDNYKISRIFNIDPILIEFIKSGLLFNNNISINTSLIANSNQKNDIFQSAKIKFHIINGKIDFNKTRFVNDNIGSLQFSNSNLFFKNNELVLNGDMLIDIKNSENLFSLLNTNKLSRKFFQTILINFDYNFSNNRIKFNRVKIDNRDVESQFLTIIDGFNNNNLNNSIKSRRLLNELFKAYAG